MSKMIQLDPAELDVRTTYRLMIGTVLPRPIAFVSTLSPKGDGNLAPFSYFNAVSSKPPVVMVSIGRKRDGSKKDTLLNIEQTKQFVVNTVSEKIAKQVNQASGDYPYGVDEMKITGLTAVPSIVVRPPRVQECPVSMECELFHLLEIGDGKAGSSTMVLGRVVMFHVLASAYKGGGLVEFSELHPLSRLGGQSFGLTSGVFEIERPKV